MLLRRCWAATRDGTATASGRSPSVQRSSAEQPRWESSPRSLAESVPQGARSAIGYNAAWSPPLTAASSPLRRVRCNATSGLQWEPGKKQWIHSLREMDPFIHRVMKRVR